MNIRKHIFPLFLAYFFDVINANFPEDFQELFRESKCIEEPDGYFNQYFLTEIQTLSDNYNPENQKNYRSIINSLILYHNLETSYDIVDEKGPAHSKIFNISLSLGEELYYGVGKTKKEAKEMAAKEAFKNTRYQKLPPKLNNENGELTPTVMLNNLAAKNGYKISYYILAPMGSKRIINLNKVKDNSLFTNNSFWKEAAHIDEAPKSPFHIEVSVNDNSFYGKAHTVQEARHNAAAKAIQSLKSQGKPIGPCGEQGHEKECKEAKNKLKSPVSLIYEFAQLEKLNVEFNEVSRSGPPHQLIFEYECLLGTFRTLAEGKSKKWSKRNAAEKMLETISGIDFSKQSNSETNKGHMSDKHRKATKNKAKSTLDIATQFVKNTINFFSSNENGDSKHDGDTEQSEKAIRRSQTKTGDKYKNRWSPKEQLLSVGKDLNLNIQFHSMPAKDVGYFSIINLDLNPKYICIGSGSNIEISQEYGSLNALKFLHKLDLLNKVDEEELDIKRFSFDNYIWLAEESPKE